MNVTKERCVPWLVASAMLITLGACSDRGAELESQPVSTEPLVLAPPDEAPLPPPIQTDAGGIPATYLPYFEADSLLRITETRHTDTERPAQAEYHYRGARLIRYTGAGLHGEGSLDLAFDLKGALISAKQSAGELADEELIAVRARAQLLRSHALAQRATTKHRKEADSG